MKQLGIDIYYFFVNVLLMGSLFSFLSAIRAIAFVFGEEI